MTELLVEPMAGFAIYELTRQAAQAIAAKKAAEAEARKPKLNPAPGSVEYFQMLNQPTRIARFHCLDQNR